MVEDQRASADEQPEGASSKRKPGNKAGASVKKGSGIGGVLGAAAAGATVGIGLGPPGIVGGSILGAIASLRKTRTSVVMARVSKENLEVLDALVDCGVTKSRSESAAFLIAQGIEANAELYKQIREHSQVIRNAREELRRLLGDDQEPSAEETSQRD